VPDFAGVVVDGIERLLEAGDATPPANLAQDEPHWEGSPTFAGCWKGCCVAVADPEQSDEVKGFAAGTLDMLAEARTIVVEPDQVEVLPKLDRDAVAETAKHLRLPFECVYLDLGAAEGVAGALLKESNGMTWLISCAWNQDARIGVPLTALDCGNLRGVMATMTEVKTRREPADGDSLVALAERIVERVVATCQFMESANVELVDRTVSRQVRRAAERKGRPIAQVVRVRLPRRRSARKARGGSAGAPTSRYRYRFEVMGHYQHQPATSPMGRAHPEKLSWFPELSGYYRRIWIPPFVKGPEGAPLVPKTRVVSARKDPR
jgi:hypothetical protein